MKKRDEPIKQEGRAARGEARISDTVILREGNISLILDSYDDIFSDFDPRGYPERALSDDFLRECIKSSADKEGDIELRLLVPKHKRNIADEIKIKKRLKDHFNKHFIEKRSEVRWIKFLGFLMILGGMVMMFGAYLLYSELLNVSEMTRNLLLVLTEPGGWFFFWIGGEKLVYGVREKKPSYTFYKKMVNAKVYFYEY
jgi:hypothetical protein